MVTYLYGGAALLSMLMLIYVSFYNFKNVEIYHWTMSIIVVFINLGYYLISTSSSIDAALTANRLVQFEGTVLPVLVIFSLLKNYRIRIPAWTKSILYLVAITLWSIAGQNAVNQSGLYYKTLGIRIINGGTVLVTTAGPLKLVVNGFVVVCLLVLICIAIYGLQNKNRFSLTTTVFYLVVALMAGMVYAITSAIDIRFELLPFVYLVGALFITLSYDRRACYEVDVVVSSNQEEDEDSGYVVFNMKKCYLASNARAEEYIPEINDLTPDAQVDRRNEKIQATLIDWICEFENGNPEPHYYRFGDKVLKCTVNTFRINKRRAPKGYLIKMVDDTSQQHYVELMRSYNDKLNSEVREKTRHISRMQAKVVLGLADMVENRDSNTGGHVKRTSDVVKILTDAMLDDVSFDVDHHFVASVVRAAPMHDLGKISIDNAILNKPGRLTDEEYAIMKTHAAKSGEIVESILKDVDEADFVELATNLARHHHERWDGKGYPDGLSGTDIPLEARIMAVADVYDALVSKRCYKEPLSFEDAARIMREGMGSQFDPSMAPVFEACRERLEAYYAGA